MYKLYSAKTGKLLYSGNSLVQADKVQDQKTKQGTETYLVIA